MLTLLLTFGIAISLLFVFKSKNPKSSRSMENGATIINGHPNRFISSFCDCRLFEHFFFNLKIKRLIKDHSQNAGAGFSQVQAETIVASNGKENFLGCDSTHPS